MNPQAMSRLISENISINNGNIMLEEVNTDLIGQLSQFICPIVSKYTGYPEVTLKSVKNEMGGSGRPIYIIDILKRHPKDIEHRQMERRQGIPAMPGIGGNRYYDGEEFDALGIDANIGSLFDVYGRPRQCFDRQQSTQLCNIIRKAEGVPPLPFFPISKPKAPVQVQPTMGPESDDEGYW